MLRHRSVKRFYVVGSLLAIVATGCGAKKSAKIEETSPGIVPSDSTGAQAPVSLGLSSAATASSLYLDAVSSVTSGSVTIEKALFNISEIKVKPNKEVSTDESAAETKKKEAEKSKEAAKEAAEQELEVETEAAKKQAEADLKAASTDSEKTAVKAALRAKLELIKKNFKVKEADAKRAEELAELEKEKASDRSIRWAGPYQYDPISGTVDTALPEAMLSDGSYKRVELYLRPLRKVSDQNESAVGSSVFVSGNVIIAGALTPFVLSYDGVEKIKLMGAGAIKIDPSAANKMMISFDVSKWFSGVDFSKATVGLDGVLLIDATNNPTILKVVRKNMKTYAGIGKDEDGDGAIKSTEIKGDGAEGVAEEEKKAAEEAAEEAKKAAEKAKESKNEEDDESSED